MTPEGKVKAAVKKYLNRYHVWSDWPVPSGYGKSTLDCQVICNGRVMWIETKAPGEKMTVRQKQLFNTFVRHGCFVVVIDTTDTEDHRYKCVGDWINDQQKEA